MSGAISIPFQFIGVLIPGKVGLGFNILAYIALMAFGVSAARRNYLMILADDKSDERRAIGNKLAEYLERMETMVSLIEKQGTFLHNQAFNSSTDDLIREIGEFLEKKASPRLAILFRSTTNAAIEPFSEGGMIGRNERMAKYYLVASLKHYSRQLHQIVNDYPKNL